MAVQIQVLVIDDHRSMRAIISRMLRNLAITDVIEAESGETALGILKSRKAAPDVILCDLYMENGGGLEFINAMRLDKDLKNTHIPVILLTGETNEFILDIGRQVGAAAILPKPCTLADLAKAIGGVVGFELTPVT